jgi:hypothetical protein
MFQGGGGGIVESLNTITIHTPTIHATIPFSTVMYGRKIVSLFLSWYSVRPLIIADKLE